MSDRRHTRRPTLPVGYQYGDARRQNLVFRDDDGRLIATIRFVRRFSRRQQEASKAYVNHANGQMFQLGMQRTGDETL